MMEKNAKIYVAGHRGMGIAPNIIVLRADGPVGNDIKRKISMFCNVRPDCVIENLTMPSLYECPLMLETAGLTNVVARQLHLQTPPTDLTEWKELISRIATRSKTCTIALVGKYVKLHDAYLSVMECRQNPHQPRQHRRRRPRQGCGRRLQRQERAHPHRRQRRQPGKAHPGEIRCACAGGYGGKRHVPCAPFAEI